MQPHEDNLIVRVKDQYDEGPRSTTVDCTSHLVYRVSFNRFFFKPQHQFSSNSVDFNVYLLSYEQFNTWKKNKETLQT
ncbi:hypothetical protein B9Z55_026353 [Caenorhabditis nigoni]|uniref:Uncharacterized protein n=1 Tax=Caenorhabditis nigoni TaxID=1611254 RepID=A0A2G5T2D4_9PELO|nr:hypothetical protein B9Z55_026353 [Caenorhabditis nigoni]